MKNGRYEENGVTYWYKDDVFHREDGPAVYGYGSQQWYLDGKLHRVGGPARKLATGITEWWANGLLHRLDGPARIRLDGTTEWRVDGRRVDIATILGYEPSVPLTEEEQMILRLNV